MFQEQKDVLIICTLDPDPWTGIFLQIRILETKMMRTQRIRILSTDWRNTCALASASATSELLAADGGGARLILHT